MARDDGSGFFLWHELMTTDPESAGRFYGSVVGWTVREWEEAPDHPYWTLMTGEAPAGGLMELPEDARNAGAPPHWLGYVGTVDVDADVGRAVELGATSLVDATDVPSVGRIAVLQDPQGAVFGLFKPETAPPPVAGESRPGFFSWHELATTDLDGAIEFYEGLLGWEETSSFDMGPMGPYRMFGANGVELGGMFRKPDDQPGPSAWLYYAQVESLDDAVEGVEENEGAVVNGPMEVPGGDRVAQCRDPQGAVFALHEATGS